MICGFHHISFTVSDLAESERFFVDLMGMIRIGGGVYDFDYIKRTVDYPDAVLEVSVLMYSGQGEDDHILELIEYRQPKGSPVDTATNRPGNAHLCLLVSGIEQEVRRLQKAGVKFKSPTPNEVTWGVNRGAKAIYFNGPDGIALELLQQPDREGTAL